MNGSIAELARDVVTAEVGPDHLPIGRTPCADFVDRCSASPRSSRMATYRPLRFPGPAVTGPPTASNPSSVGRCGRKSSPIVLHPSNPPIS